MTKKEIRMKKPFQITSVCRQDIAIEKLMTEKEALKIKDDDMEYIADKMYYGMDYWACLSTAVELLKNRK